MIYPFYAINSYYNRLKNYQEFIWIEMVVKQYPNDYKALLWLKRILGKTIFYPRGGRQKATLILPECPLSGFPTVFRLASSRMAVAGRVFRPKEPRRLENV